VNASPGPPSFARALSFAAARTRGSASAGCSLGQYVYKCDCLNRQVAVYLIGGSIKVAEHFYDQAGERVDSGVQQSSRLSTLVARPLLEYRGNGVSECRGQRRHRRCADSVFTPVAS
jgi:hypothetical protein